MVSTRPLRSPIVVTLTVWKALFLHEILARLTRERLAWLWMLIEPIAHVAVLMWMYTVGMRTRIVAGADAAVFIMLGIMGFFVVRNIMNHSINVVGTSDSLYAYRQVKPVDTVLARAAVEGTLTCLLFSVIFFGAGMAGHPIRPADPLGALQALGVLWLTGLGLGLIVSVLSNLVDEIGHMVRLLMTPAYFLSGVIIPTSTLPRSIQEILMYNPILHGIESLRLAFMPLYHVPPGIELAYLVKFAVVTIFLGLVLHLRYKRALMER